MTLMEKVLRVNEHPNEAGSQIPGDSACKTDAVDAARQSHGFQRGVHVTTMCVALWQ
jgi:hypothetical protein